MNILHIVNQSPYDTNAFNSCLKILGKHDGLLLMGNGAYVLTHKDLQKRLRNLQTTGVDIYFLQEDVVARGLTLFNEHGFALIDYQGFVELTDSHSKSMSWF